jgi:aryl-alcohol dehydrogenase-like predicted oxidoreductase
LKGAAQHALEISTKILPPYDAASIRKAVDASLKRLRIDAADVLYLHRWDETLNAPEAWQELGRLRKKGKIRELGVSNFNSQQLRDALRLQKEIGVRHLRYIQNNHNLAVSDLNDEIRQLCTDHGVHIVTYSPLGAGFLTGKHVNAIEKGSRFELMPAHQQVYFVDHAQKRLEKLLRLAAQTGYSAAHLALAWALHQPGISSVLIGGRSVEHIDQALEAAKFYSAQLFAELEQEPV